MQAAQNQATHLKTQYKDKHVVVTFNAARLDELGKVESTYDAATTQAVYDALRAFAGEYGVTPKTTRCRSTSSSEILSGCTVSIPCKKGDLPDIAAALNKKLGENPLCAKVNKGVVYNEVTALNPNMKSDGLVGRALGVLQAIGRVLGICK